MNRMGRKEEKKGRGKSASRVEDVDSVCVKQIHTHIHTHTQARTVKFTQNQSSKRARETGKEKREEREERACARWLDAIRRVKLFTEAQI